MGPKDKRTVVLHTETADRVLHGPSVVCLSPPRSGFVPTSDGLVFAVGKVIVGQVLVRVHGLTLVIIIPPVPHTH
jgi:hypothetical protein